MRQDCFKRLYLQDSFGHVVDSLFCLLPQTSQGIFHNQSLPARGKSKRTTLSPWSVRRYHPRSPAVSTYSYLFFASRSAWATTFGGRTPARMYARRMSSSVNAFVPVSVSANASTATIS